MTYDIKNDKVDSKESDSRSTEDKAADKDVEVTRKANVVNKEAILELVEVEEGIMHLRDVNETAEPLVTINFSEKVQGMLDGETYSVGQHMIHSAIQMVMHKQVSNWHANVYDEEPDHYS